MFKLVKTTKEMMVEELVRSLYKEDLFAEMLVEQEEVSALKPNPRSIRGSGDLMGEWGYVRDYMHRACGALSASHCFAPRALARSSHRRCGLSLHLRAVPERWQCGASTCRRWSSSSAKQVQSCKNFLLSLFL
jgi:hypothetical protein